MKILILIDWFAPAFKGGGPIQSVMNMVASPDEAFEYRIICSNKDLDGTILPTTPDVWVTYNERTAVWYASGDKKILRLVNETAASWGADILFINGIYSLHYNFLPILFAKAPRKIISVRGTLHDGALSQKSAKKKVFLNLWKALRLHRKYEFHASAEEESEYVKKVFGEDTRVFVAANFPKSFKLSLSPPKKANQLQLVSVALISPMKNHLHVLEALVNCTGNIQYSIYGPVKDPVYWDKCLQQIKLLPANVTVNYGGEVQPHDVESVLQTSHVFVLPSKSENFGHAIYEALSAGKPVITSRRTPWNGLQEAKAGSNVTPEAIAELTDAISFFCSLDAAAFSDWSKSAIAYANAKIDFEQIQLQYRKMFLANSAATLPKKMATQSHN